MKNKKTILVVDDIEVNRKVLSTILENEYRIIEAENGLVAKKRLEQFGQKLSLILLDIVMPEMDGFTFLKYMHNDKEYKDIPVILVSAETYEENILNAVKYGVRDVIAKPFSPELVLTRVKHLIALAEGSTATPAPAPEDARPEGCKNAPNTVLIVDDVGINRVILRGALEDDYEFLEAENGLDALNLLRKRRSEIAIVLLDIMMPVMDGYAMMRTATHERLLKNIPVMAITAEDSLPKLSQLMDLGVCEVIQKPFTPSVVKNRVDNIVKLKRIGSAV